MNFIFIYITNPTKKEAKEIARYLLKKKLIACANIFPISSLYWWSASAPSSAEATAGKKASADKTEKIAEEKEFVLIAKTTDSNFEKVKKEVEKIHPYSIPCIIKIPVSSNKKYFDWLKGEIKE